jgi:hypothetical protein
MPVVTKKFSLESPTVVSKPLPPYKKVKTARRPLPDKRYSFMQMPKERQGYIKPRNHDFF